MIYDDERILLEYPILTKRTHTCNNTCGVILLEAECLFNLCHPALHSTHYTGSHLKIEEVSNPSFSIDLAPPPTPTISRLPRHHLHPSASRSYYSPGHLSTVSTFNFFSFLYVDFPELKCEFSSIIQLMGVSLNSCKETIFM